MDHIVRIRTSVVENHLSVEQMAALGITLEGILAEIASGDLRCWVAEEDNEVKGFSMADRRDASIFALFVSPGHEGKGHGSGLLEACEDWLKAQGHVGAVLDTGRGTTAYAFYLKRGWQPADENPHHCPGDAVLRKMLA